MSVSSAKIGAVSAAFVGIVFGMAASAASVSGFSSVWFFGDSLSDPGNLFAATGGTTPPDPPYFQGRTSNGPVWAEYVAEPFARRGLPSANFAFAGAHAATNDDVAMGLPAQIPDLAAQVGAFSLAAPGLLGKRPAAAMWAGANDILSETAKTAPDTRAAGAIAAAAVGASARQVGALGVRDIFLVNLPPLDLTPRYNLFQPQLADLAKIGSDTFNDQLDLQIAALTQDGLRVRKIDLFRAFNEMIVNPAQFGLSDAVRPCVVPGVSVCTPEESLARVFFDLVHPNSIAHAEIAKLATPTLAPVPVPTPLALLAGGLALLGALRWRAQSRVRRNRSSATSA